MLPAPCQRHGTKLVARLRPPPTVWRRMDSTIRPPIAESCVVMAATSNGEVITRQAANDYIRERANCSTGVAEHGPTPPNSIPPPLTTLPAATFRSRPSPGLVSRCRYCSVALHGHDTPIQCYKLFQFDNLTSPLL